MTNGQRTATTLLAVIEPIDQMQRKLSSVIRRSTWHWYWLSVLSLIGTSWAVYERMWQWAVIGWLAGWVVTYLRAKRIVGSVDIGARIFMAVYGFVTWPIYCIKEFPLYIGRTPYLASRQQERGQ